MINMRDLIDLKKRILRKFILPHQVAEAGWEVFKASLTGESSPEEDLGEITEQYKANVIESGFEKICEIQAGYVTKMVDGGHLLDEERFKILSLCDEICALENIGMCFPVEQKESFESTMRKHFNMERRRYTGIAKARIDEFNNEFWHYKLIL